MSERRPLKIAVPNKGSLSEASTEMLREAGMSRIPGEQRYARRAENDRLGVPVTAIMREFFETL